MKFLTTIFLFFFCFQVHAQKKYNFNNEALDIPDWLRNPSYVADNETEELTINLMQEQLGAVNGNSVVWFSIAESEYTHSETTIYIATFGKDLNIIDITHVADQSASDWNWPEESYFKALARNIFSYLYIDVKYRPAENEEEQRKSGGLVPYSKDTTLGFYKIGNDGTIRFSEDLILLEEEDIEEEEEFDEEERILEIREIFTHISKNAPNYQKRGTNYRKNTFLSYFYDGNELKKILAVHKPENNTEEFYFDNNELIFVFAVNKFNKEENRYYFHHHALFRWLKGSSKQTISLVTEEFKARATDLQTRAKQYVEIYGKE